MARAARRGERRLHDRLAGRTRLSRVMAVGVAAAAAGLCHQRNMDEGDEARPAHGLRGLAARQHR